MRLGTRHTIFRFAIVSLSLAIGIILAAVHREIDQNRADVVWQVSLGFFSALLTALTIVFAVTISPQTRWPSFTDIVAAIGMNLWLVIGTVSVAAAAGGDMLGDRLLVSVGEGLGVAQLLLGLDTLLLLLRFRSATGRKAVLVRLANRRIHLAGATDGTVHAAEHPQLADLRDDIEYSIDRQDVAEISARVDEIVVGWPSDSTPERARSRLALLTYLLERLGRSILYQNLTGDICRAVMPHLVEGSLRVSWRLSSFTFRQRDSDHRDEVASAVALGQVCRVIGWLQQAAHERMQTRPNDTTARQLVNAMLHGRQRIIQYVDPDPPGFYRTPEDPWPYGLSDPRATLYWLYAMCDFGGSWVGNGLYVLCEVLTGEKFFGNYWNGDCIFNEIETRIGRRGERAPHCAKVIPAYGDLGSISLEFSSAVIAGLRNRRFSPPEGLEKDANYSADPRYLCSQISMFATYDCLRDADEGLSWMAKALTGAPTHKSLCNATVDAFNRFCEPSSIPMRALDKRPAAITLTTLFRLSMNRPREARRLVKALPDPLVAGALQHARFAMSVDSTGEPLLLTWTGDGSQRVLGSRRAQERELLNTVEEVLSHGGN